MLTPLERTIKLTAQLYYQDGSSPLSDPEFDKLVEQLKRENPGSEILSKPSFGYSIDEDSTPGGKFPHRYGRIEGLGKAYSWIELPKQFKTTHLYESPKLDGMSVAMYFIRGKLDQALTRGDYNSGKDVTAKVKMIIGDSISNPYFTGGVRGEIIMSKKNYELYQGCHEDVKNARNVVAGIINSKDITEDIKYLDIVVYTILADESQKLNTVGDMISYNNTVGIDCIYQFLKLNFMHVAPYSPLATVSGDKFEKVMDRNKAAWDSTYQYEIDGVVLCIPTVNINDKGEFIYDEIAYKFKSEIAETVVEGIEWNMSKTHYAVPKIIVREVTLDGTSVTKATGFNAKYIKDNHIVPGAIVEIEKHGEIIPNVNKVIATDTSKDCLINTCPECGQPLEWSGVHLMCKNPICGNAVLQDALIWIDTLAPLDNFGDKLRIKWLSKYLGDNISVEAIIRHPELKEMSKFHRSHSASPLISKQLLLFSKMLDILYTGRFKLSDAIKALNIPRFGDITSEKFAKYPDLVKMCIRCGCDIKMIGGIDKEVHDQLKVDLENSIGLANADSVMKNLEKFARLTAIDSRVDFDNSRSSPSTIRGRVAITGKLSVKRSEFEKELRSYGWEVGEISKDTDFLITDNPNSSSSKNKKADQWKINKITEYEFRSRFMEG